jgi:putrescine transport system substrate-binding protein
MPTDPDANIFVPYQTTTTGIAYDAVKVGQRLPSVALDGWSLLFNPAKAGEPQACGIAIIDAPSEVLQIALNCLGFDPVDPKEADMAKAEQLLTGIRPSMHCFDSSKILSDLVSGDICIALT